ncbi:hypothetical protein [Pengzhenrongella frigida]|uniref:Uncharacterized protein n=1 Tax=Pengzhenrongella frigida TaxID=1259133 RepID=A0A4Q5MZP4_9MICO|nr:hypothetical protein [Cellulomonas sp. HLT2-17]RYV51248.1 hypothetical protein EUA98_09525 [Cellulomonas sp. HLT2-17]
MSIYHLLSLPRWLIVAIVVVVGLLGVEEQLGRGAQARAQEIPCTFESVDYTYGHAAALGGRGVTGAEISGVAPVCAGRIIRLTFVAADGSPLAAAATRIQAPLTVLELPVAETLATDRIERFDVVLES